LEKKRKSGRNDLKQFDDSIRLALRQAIEDNNYIMPANAEMFSDDARKLLSTILSGGNDLSFDIHYMGQLSSDVANIGTQICAGPGGVDWVPPLTGEAEFHHLSVPQRHAVNIATSWVYELYRHVVEVVPVNFSLDLLQELRAFRNTQAHREDNLIMVYPFESDAFWFLSARYFSIARVLAAALNAGIRNFSRAGNRGLAAVEAQPETGEGMGGGGRC